MNLRKRLERLEQRLARRPGECGKLAAWAFQALSSTELDDYLLYVEQAELGLQPSAAALAAAERHRTALEIEWRAAGFRSHEEFAAAYRTELNGDRHRGLFTWQDGTILKARFWRFWKRAEWEIPGACLHIGKSRGYRATVTLPDTGDDPRMQSWSIGVERKGAGGPDQPGGICTVGQLWAFRHGSAYLLDQVCFSLDLEQTVEVVGATASRWRPVNAILIDRTVGGTTVATALEADLHGLKVGDSSESGIERVHCANELLRRGRVYLPHPLICPWVTGFLAEAGGYPDGREQGQVRAMSQVVRSVCQDELYGFHWPQVTVASPTD